MLARVRSVRPAAASSARATSSFAVPFTITLVAPAETASSTAAPSGSPVMQTTGMVGYETRSRRRRSAPLMPGSRTSTATRSGASSATAPSADSPSGRRPTTAIPLRRSCVVLNVSPNTSLSSTSSTRSSPSSVAGGAATVAVADAVADAARSSRGAATGLRVGDGGAGIAAVAGSAPGPCAKAPRSARRSKG